MRGYRFSRIIADAAKDQNDFQRLLKIFMELLLITSGDVSEALQWLTDVDRKYKLTNPDYGIGDFIEDLKTNGYLKEDDRDGSFKITPKTEQSIRKRSLEEIFGSEVIERPRVEVMRSCS